MASSSVSSKKRAHRGWITVEELAAEGAAELAVDEEGKPYVLHTSKAKYKEAQDTVRAVFFRQTAALRRGSARGPALTDGVDEEDRLWKEAENSKSARRKRVVSDKYKADKIEAKIDRRVKSGKQAIENAGKGKTGRGLIIEKVKASFLLSVVPESVPCRTDQENNLMLQINERIRADAAELLYVSGQPGTGKTLTVHRVVSKILQLREAKSLPDFKFVSINALNDLPTPQTLFERMYADVTGIKLTPNKAQRAMELWYSTTDKPSPHFVVLLLDEMDSLVTTAKQSATRSTVLHTLLEWMSRPKSRLLIIGISNTIDLLERLDSKTLSRGGMAVQKILFRPYSWTDISEILESRLASAGVSQGELFDKLALELCAKKTANEKGDVRRALQVCLRAVERCEEKLIEGGTVSTTVIAECLKDLRSGSFASALCNLSLMEKLFMWGMARECSITGDSLQTFPAIEMRISVELAQVRHVTAMDTPSRSTWEQIRDSLLSSHMLVCKDNKLSCPGEFQPEDIAFYMKKHIREDPILSHLPKLSQTDAYND